MRTVGLPARRFALVMVGGFDLIAADLHLYVNVTQERIRSPGAPALVLAGCDRSRRHATPVLFLHPLHIGEHCALDPGAVLVTTGRAISFAKVV